MSTAVITKARPAAAKPWYRILYVQVLIAIVLGALFGWLEPTIATNDWIKALGDGFIKLIKMVIAPIIFCTVVSGIAHIQDARKVGRIGVKDGKGYMKEWRFVDGKDVLPSDEEVKKMRLAN